MDYSYSSSYFNMSSPDMCFPDYVFENITEDSYYALYEDLYFDEPLWVQVVFAVFFAIITILGLGGNAIVCYIVLGNSRMRTVTNYFVVNLAVGDMLMATMCVNFTFYATMYNFWPFGAIMCKCVSFFQSVAVSVSIFTLVAISVDRYIAIIHPLRPKPRSKSTLIAIGFVWICACAISVPPAYFAEYSVYNGSSDCSESMEWEHSKTYSIIAMCVQYFIPLTILAFAYGRIGFRVWKRKTPGEADALRDKKAFEAKVRIVKMFATVVLLFAVCYLPIQTFAVIQDVFPEIRCFHYIKILYLMAIMIGMSNCVYNPFIYCWMNAKFRNGFRSVFRCLRTDVHYVSGELRSSFRSGPLKRQSTMPTQT